MFKEFQNYANHNTKESGQKWHLLRNAYGHAIIEIFKQFPFNKGRALLLGAGNGNDIPLDFFEYFFEEIVVVDIDQEALDRLMTKVVHKDKFKIIVMDLSGLTDEIDAMKLNSLLLTDDWIKSLQPKPNFTSISGSFDLIMNCNYSTQLCYPIVKYASDHQIPQQSLSGLSDLINRIQTDVFKRINELLNENSIFIHSTDTIELSLNKITGEKSKTYDFVMDAIHNDTTQLTNILEILPQLSKQSLLINGSQLPENYKTLFECVKLNFLFWPFESSDRGDRSFIVAVYMFRKHAVSF